MPQAFAPPDWDAPLDAEGRIARAPDGATVRGMFLQDSVEAMRAGGVDPGPRKYIAFKTYPVQEYMALVVEAARALHPRKPLRAALRHLGRDVYPTFEKTMVGSAIFAFAGRDFGRVAKLAGRGYGVSLSPGGATTEFVEDGHLRACLRSIWVFPDCFQIGVWEGALDVCGAKGSIEIDVLGDCDVDYDVRWT